MWEIPIHTLDTCNRAHVHRSVSAIHAMVNGHRWWSTSWWGGNKNLLVVINYSTRRVDNEPLNYIASATIKKFVWIFIITRYEIVEAFEIDNSTHFSNARFWICYEKWNLEEFCISSLPKHAQIKVTNQTFKDGLHKLLEGKKGAWLEELTGVCYIELQLQRQ